MPSFRLRVRSTEIDLPVGELVIGRGTDCFLRIDDDLVSRRHARLLVTEIGVTFEDLGSRNGSRVNGAKTTVPSELRLGDTFEVGSQVFQLLLGGQKERVSARTMLPQRACRGCQLLIDATAERCPHCGGSQRDETRHDTNDFGDDEPQTQAFSSSFALVTGLGDKLLALGRTDEAERMIAPRLRDLLARARDGEALDAKVVSEALRQAVKLATLTGRDEWYRFLFDLARFTGTRLDARTLDDLHATMMAQRPAAAEPLMYYFTAQQGDEPEVALYRKRLEALLRFCRD